jgi:hypothetical protein
MGLRIRVGVRIVRLQLKSGLGAVGLFGVKVWFGSGSQPVGSNSFYWKHLSRFGNKFGVKVLILVREQVNIRFKAWLG